MKKRMADFLKTYRIVIWIILQAVTIIALISALEFHFDKLGSVVVFIFVFFAIVFSGVLFLNADRKSRKKEKEIQLMKAEVEIIKAYYSQLEKKLDDINKLRHELRNTLDVVNLEKETAQKYLSLTETFDKKVEKIYNHKFCENALLNIIISEKANEAQQNETRFVSAVSIPESIAIDEFDLFSCIYNLLDNAVFANKGQTDSGSDKFIELKAETIGSYLIIKQRNSAYEKTRLKDNGEFATTKELNSEHGFGLKIISEICEKYDGQAEFEHKDDVFYSTLSLKLSSAK